MSQLPETATEGTRVWVWSEPGVGWEYERVGDKWVAVAGCAAPYIPQMENPKWDTTAPT